MKHWVTVACHKGYEVKTLDGAEAGDEMDYIIEPVIEEGRTYKTVGEAFEAIDNQQALRRASTEDLINELESRPGVKKISVGLYQPYELKRKYHSERLSDEEAYVEAKVVLVCLQTNETTAGTVAVESNQASDNYEDAKKHCEGRSGLIKSTEADVTNAKLNINLNLIRHHQDEVEAIASELAKTLNSLDNKIDEMKLGKEFEPYTGKLASLILQIPKIQGSHQYHMESSKDE